MTAGTVSFEFYYSKYYQQVFGYIYKKLRNTEMAEDAAQDVFVKCFEKFDTFDPERASFQTWLYVIVNNKLKDIFKGDVGAHIELDDPLQFIEPVEEGFADEFETAVYLQGMREELAFALETLVECDRRIIIMSFFENRTSKEIAFAMGMSDVNVRVRQSRAIVKLRAYFESRNIGWEM